MKMSRWARFRCPNISIFILSSLVLAAYFWFRQNRSHPSLPYQCQHATRDILRSQTYQLLLDAVKTQRLSFMSRCSLMELMSSIISLECDKLTPANAVMIEAGVAAGGSAICFASVKRKYRPFYLYDTFEGMPEPSERDGTDVHRRYEQIQRSKGKNDGYYGNIPDLKTYVERKFSKLGVPIERYGVKMEQGLFQSTIPANDGSPVMFVNVDGDWYDSVYTVLDRVGKRIIPGGLMYIDDYDSYSGATNATKDFLAEERNRGKWELIRVNCPGGRPYLRRLP